MMLRDTWEYTGSFKWRGEKVHEYSNTTKCVSYGTKGISGSAMILPPIIYT